METNTNEKVDDFLAHYGVKGMRWGVRRINIPKSDIPEGSGGGGGEEDEELDWEDLSPEEKKQFALAVKQNGGTTVSAFLKRVAAARQLNASRSNLVKGPNGTSVNPDSVNRYVNGKRVVSTAKTTTQKKGNTTVTTDKLPNYTRVTKTTDVGKDTLDKAAEWMKNLFRHNEDLRLDGNYIEHFGVKGMRWGVRRSNTQLASGGSDKDRSDDSMAAKTAIKKVKSGGLKSLSNKELSDLNTRLTLEANFSKLTTPQKKAGKSFIQKALGAADTTNKIIKLMDSPAGKAMQVSLSQKTGKGGSASKVAKASESFTSDVSTAWAAARTTNQSTGAGSVKLKNWTG